MRFFLIIIFIYGSPLQTQAQYVLSLDALFHMEREKRMEYIDWLQGTLAQKNIPNLVAEQYPSTDCGKRGLLTCNLPLYGKDKCIQLEIKANSQCLKIKSDSKDTEALFDVPRDIKIFWFHFRRRTQGYCRRKLHNKSFCKSLKDKTQSYKETS